MKYINETDYNQSRNYDYDGDYNRGSNMGSGGYGSSNYGYNRDRDDMNRNEYGRNYGNTNYDSNSERWSDEGYGGGYSSGRNYGDTGYESSNRDWNRSNDWRNRGSDWNKSSDWNRGSDWHRNHEGNRRNEDRGWWDKTKDEVSSWFGDEDAERRRNRDEMRSNRGRGPKNYQRSEERIREDVCDRLSDDYLIDASEIDIKVNGSEVVLTGTVDSRNEKRRAEDVAESVSVVTNVQNQLRVSSSAYGSSSTSGSSSSKMSNTGTGASMGSTTGTTGTTNR